MIAGLWLVGHLVVESASTWQGRAVAVPATPVFAVCDRCDSGTLLSRASRVVSMRRLGAARVWSPAPGPPWTARWSDTEA